MKKYKLKQWLLDIIVCLGAATFVVTILSCLSLSVKQYDDRMIEQEYTKKTEMSNTQISQK